MKDAKKGSSKDERENISTRIGEASAAVGALVKSVVMTIEEKIALEDQVKSLSRDADYMLDRIDDVAREKQKKLLLAYRKFLEQNLSAVDYRIKKLG